MNKHSLFFSALSLLASAHLAYATPDKAQLSVWVNEAIVATYSYDYKNYLQEQKEIAKYFTSEGWIAYTKALNDSKLPESVAKNNYYVSAVATEPPVVVSKGEQRWQASMPVLVMYKNPSYAQQQTLKVVVQFTTAKPGQGVRGLSITSLQATPSAPPCVCSKATETKSDSAVP
jgi:hypothetical protein